MLRRSPQLVNLTKPMRQGLSRYGMPHTPRRLGSTSKRIMVHPHKLFTDSYPPAQPPTLESLSPIAIPIRQSIEKETRDDQRTLLKSQHRMEDALRSCHEHEIPYLDGNSLSQGALSHGALFVSPVQDLLALVKPVANFTDSHPFVPLPALERLSPAFIKTRQSIEWKESAKDQLVLSRSLDRMQDALRSVHKHKISWPNGGSVSHESTAENLVSLLRPVADLFNELHSDSVLKERPLEYVGLCLSESVFAGTFSMDHEERNLWDVNIPMVITLHNDITNPSGTITDQVEHAVNLGLAHESSPRLVLVTNFRDIVAFFPSRPGHPDNSFTKVSTIMPALALRAICAATIHESTITGIFIDTPGSDLVPYSDPDIILPEGPPQDPDQPLLPDEEVFRTHRRFSEFDKVTLVRDSARALQFFRWHALVRSNYPTLVLGPGDTVSSNSFMTPETPEGFKPLYPFDWDDLPPDTLAHVRATQRGCPVKAAGLVDALKGSKSIKLKITDAISKGTDRGFATVYRCELTSIDNNPVSMSAPLCLKLFDDRFTRLDYPGGDEGELDDKPLHCWFDYVRAAETKAWSEHSAYEKLRPVQGTVVPWYYGVYEFTLPDQTTLYGTLMEYIPGDTLNSDFTHTLSSERQISIIKSCRHAVRVLDVADINQDDWRAGHIMLFTNPETNIDHCVFIDFADSRMTWSAYEPLMLANYTGCSAALSGDAKGSLFDEHLLSDRFGVPDDWDPVTVISECPATGEVGMLHAKDPFTYISFPST